jgi:hypothetical protein
MKYKYSKTVRDKIEFTLIKPCCEVDGSDLMTLINRHGPNLSNVIIIEPDKNNLFKFKGIDHDKFLYFSSNENFDDLIWVNATL